MQDQIHETILLQHGRCYAFGRGTDFYGIWDTTPTPIELVERFPLNRESWYQARRRFEELERQANGWPPNGSPTTHPSPGSQGMVDRYLAASSGTIIIGVILGVVALFPRYLGNSSIVSQGDQLLPHIFYLIGWAITAAALLARRQIARGAMLFGLGLSAMTFGFYLSDLGSAVSGVANSGGVGLYLAIIGWLLCAAGCVGALYRLQGTVSIAKPGPSRLPLVVIATLLAIGTAVTFVPSWDRYTLFSIASGQSQSVTEGYAFSNPGIVIAADVVIMVLLVALVALALSWRKLLLGIALFAGALVPQVAQIFSALIQTATSPSVSAFGINPNQAAAAQLRVTTGLTTWYYLYCACVGLLIVIALFAVKSARGRTKPSQSMIGPNDGQRTSQPVGYSSSDKLTAVP